MESVSGTSETAESVDPSPTADPSAIAALASALSDAEKRVLADATGDDARAIPDTTDATGESDAMLSTAIAAFAAVPVPPQQPPTASASVTRDPALALATAPAASAGAPPAEAAATPATADSPAATPVSADSPAKAAAPVADATPGEAQTPQRAAIPTLVAPQAQAVATPNATGESQTPQGAQTSAPTSAPVKTAKPGGAAHGTPEMSGDETNAEATAEAAAADASAPESLRENTPAPARVPAREASDRVQAFAPANDFAPLARPGTDGGAQLSGLQAGRELMQANAATAAPAGAQGTDSDTLSTQRVPLEAVAVEIVVRAQSGRNRFEIRLDPPELGRIEVRLDIDRSGQVTSRLLVERAETLDVLRRDAHQIERALQDAGLRTSDNGLQFSLRDQPFADRNHADTPRAAPAEPDRPPVIDGTPAVYAVTLRGGSGVDIRV
jgi:flagellar hook-length control protein FliK